MKFGISKDTERKLTRLALRILPIFPGPEIYDLFIDLKKGSKDIDEKINRAHESLKETSTLIDDLEADLKERTSKIKELKEKYEEYSELAGLEEEKVRPILDQLEKAAGKGKVTERIMSFIINLIAGLVIFILGAWLGPKLQYYFSGVNSTIKPQTLVSDNPGVSDHSNALRIMVSDKSMITSKMVVLDSRKGTTPRYCIGESKKLEEMNEYDCSFLVNDVEYILKEKFLFGKKGQLNEYWTYKSEGPIIYSFEELKNDSAFLEFIGGALQSVKISDGLLIDSGDTLTISKLLPVQKMIFVEGSPHFDGNKTLIYNYE